MMLVNKFGLGLQDPMISANEKYPSFLFASSNLIGAVTEKIAFSTAGHLMEIREERRDGQKIQDDTNKAKLK